VIFCIPVDPDGRVGHGWGRAQAVALATVDAVGRVATWDVAQVGWGESHDLGSEGSHHARIVRFLREHRVGCVVAEHMGPGMQRVMTAMKIPTFLGAAGSARDCVEQAAAILAARLGQRSIEVGAVLVDMDGTVVDSGAAVRRVWVDYSAEHGLDAEEVLAFAQGRRPTETLARFSPEDPDPEATAARLQSQEMELREGVTAVPGAADLWHGIGGGEPGAKVALVTSASRPLAEIRMAAAGLAMPAVAICAEDVAEGKPSPDGYLAAAEALDVPIEDCLVLEDSAAGIAAALASGAKVIALGAPGPADHDAHLATLEDLTGLEAEPTASGKLEIRY
jgi:sugar-phosphatase